MLGYSSHNALLLITVLIAIFDITGAQVLNEIVIVLLETWSLAVLGGRKGEGARVLRREPGSSVQKQSVAAFRGHRDSDRLLQVLENHTF